MEGDFLTNSYVLILQWENLSHSWEQKSWWFWWSSFQILPALRSFCLFAGIGKLDFFGCCFFVFLCLVFFVFVVGFFFLPCFVFVVVFVCFCFLHEQQNQIILHCKFFPIAGILADFALQATMFTAFLALDARR